MCRLVALVALALVAATLAADPNAPKGKVGRQRLQRLATWPEHAASASLHACVCHTYIMVRVMGA